MEKKEKANLVIPIEKNQKTRNWLVKKLKTPLGLLSYNAKSAKYSSPSCRAASADIPDPLSPFLPIIHRLRQVPRTRCFFRNTPRVSHVLGGVTAINVAVADDAAAAAAAAAAAVAL